MLLIVLAAYVLAAPYRPALSAALPFVAGEARLASANAMIGTTRQLMTFVGPVVGTVVLRVSSPTAAFAVNAGSFLLAAGLMAGVAGLAGRPPGRPLAVAEHRTRWSRDLGEGWREVATTAGLSVLTLLVFTMYLARGAELVLFVFLAEERLGLGSAGVGILTGAAGLGAVCVLPFLTRIASSDRPALTTWLAVATTGVPLTVMAVVHEPWVACLGLLVLGGGVVVFEVLSVVLLQRLTHVDVMGRVFGLVGTASNAGKLAGALMAPVLVAAVGLGGAFAATGMAALAVGVLAVPGLRALSRTTRQRREQLRPIVDVLATLGIFEGAPTSSLERIAASLEPEAIDAGVVVLREGDPVDDLFVIRSGSFSVTNGGTPVNTMGAGEWFGEIGMVQRRPRTATVVATTRAAVWRIPGQTFLAELEDNGAEPSALLEVMADRLARTSSLQ